jgi:hypothetical protein
VKDPSSCRDIERTKRDGDDDKDEDEDEEEDDVLGSMPNPVARMCVLGIVPASTADAETSRALAAPSMVKAGKSPRVMSSAAAFLLLSRCKSWLLKGIPPMGSDSVKSLLKSNAATPRRVDFFLAIDFDSISIT